MESHGEEEYSKTKITTTSKRALQQETKETSASIYEGTFSGKGWRAIDPEKNLVITRAFNKKRISEGGNSIS